MLSGMIVPGLGGCATGEAADPACEVSGQLVMGQTSGTRLGGGGGRWGTMDSGPYVLSTHRPRPPGWASSERTPSFCKACYFDYSITSRSSSYSKNIRYMGVTQANLLAQSTTLAFLKLLFEEYKEGNLGHLGYRRREDGNTPRYRFFCYVSSRACLNRKHISRGVRWLIQASQLSRHICPKTVRMSKM
jgi:hypothetical protein